MSVVVLRSINCDQTVAPDCWFFDSEGSPESAATLRAELAKIGWAVNRPGGEDICPRCVAHMASDAAPEATDVL